MLAGLLLSLVPASDHRDPADLAPPRPRPQAEAEQSVAIRVERLILRPGEELAKATLLIERGVIVAIGTELAVPEGARVIEGEVACAGFIDPWCSLGLEPGGAADLTLTPAARTADALDPWVLPARRREALLAGVTAARLQIGRDASIAGIGALVRTREDSEADIVLEDACMAGTLGVTRRGRVGDPFDRVGEVDRLVGALSKGRRYREALLEYARDLEEWNEEIAEKEAELEKDFKKAKKSRAKDQEKAKEREKEFKEKKYKEDKKPRKGRYNADDEALARAVDGELPLVVEVHGAAEIRRLLDKTERFPRLRLVLAGGTQALHFAEELVERSIPVIVWPAPMGTERSDEYRHHDPALAGELERAGVRVLIGSGGGAEARELRLLAALAVGHGLEREAALAAITVAPAEVFDAADQVGSLRLGCSADVLVFDGDPLDTTARLRFVVSHGEVIEQ